MLRSLNIRVVLVHGAADQIQALADEQHITASDLEGTGITDAADARTRAHRGQPADTRDSRRPLGQRPPRAPARTPSPLTRSGIVQGVDHLFTGKVERVDIELLQTLLAQGVVPVIPPLGFDGDGKTYRVNSDAVAIAVAEALKAMKLDFHHLVRMG